MVIRIGRDVFHVGECPVMVEVISSLTDYKYLLAEETGHSPFMTRLHDVAPKSNRTQVGSCGLSLLYRCDESS